LKVCAIWSSSGSSGSRSFWITDEDGSEVFQVDWQALQFRKTFELRDRAGAVW
jgi:uncharacterized protein YxjI